MFKCLKRETATLLETPLPNLNSANVFLWSVLGQTAIFKDSQFFWLYGSIILLSPADEPILRKIKHKGLSACMLLLELSIAYQCFMPPQCLYVNAFWITIYMYMTCGFVLKLIIDIHLDDNYHKCINNTELGGMYFRVVITTFVCSQCSSLFSD